MMQNLPFVRPEHRQPAVGRLKIIDAHSSIWKVGAITGIGLVTVGLGAGYFDESTRFKFEFLSDHFGVFLVALFLGILSSFVLTIVWARSITKRARARAAGLIFVTPWIFGLLSYPVEGFNVHGPSALLWFLVMPAASILALVFRIMAD